MPLDAEPRTAPRGRSLTYLVLAAVVLLGLALRIASVLGTEVESPIRADAADYFSYAYNLRHLGVYSRTPTWALPDAGPPVADALRSPGYPLFLAAFVDGPPTRAMLDRTGIAQALLGAACIVLAFLLTRRLLGPGWALLVALLTALSPHLVVASSYLLTEVLFCLLTVAALVALTGFRPDRPWIAALGGVLLGAAVLTRPTLLYFLFPLAAYLAWVWRRERALAGVLLVVLGFGLVYAPWVLRNHLTPGDLQEDRLLVNALHHGLYPDFMYAGDPASFGFPYRADPRGEAIGRDVHSVLAEVKRRFATEPGTHLRWYLLGKPAALWSWDIVAGMGDVFVYPVTKTPYWRSAVFHYTHRLMHALHRPLMLLALTGAVLVWLPLARRALTAPQLIAARTLALLVAYVTALHTVGAPFPRYGVPFRPLAYALAAVALALALAAIRARATKRG
jgi:4-amino-4-deoxy-L-arabinose transferase-like glycosyltransferase